VLLAEEDVHLAAPADPVLLTVGELAERIWRRAGSGEPAIDLVGIRQGETLSEVLTGEGEHLGAERFQGIAPIEGEISLSAANWVAERLDTGAGRAEARAVWLEAMSRPGLLAVAGAGR
jgi:FlaA1/EpsC-like NDP-sugar epimerase